MARVKIRDMVVVLPGITGSVLQKDGRDLWAISGQAVWRILASLGDTLQDLLLVGDDPAVDDLGDGIRATGVIQDLHMVPGLVKIDGYSGLRRLFTQEFEVVPGSPDDERPANYFEFAYDWRRDNRYAARKLQELVNRKLPQWREHSGAQDARVILVAHSMGGLISRYYLEVLQGWRDCRALITFGTPYRGSVNALGYLANGYKQLFLDLTEVMRSFTAAYQLLPIYRSVQTGQGFARVAEIDGIPGIDRDRAAAALRFHREIEEAVAANRKEADYFTQGYRILPVVGTRQKTFQSATLAGGRLTVAHVAPEGVPTFLADGDGTVPRVSAIPIELSNEFFDTFVAEKHSSLQNNGAMLEQLLERVKLMQAPELGAIRDVPPARPPVEQMPALALEVEDLYLAQEPVTIQAQTFNVEEPVGLVAEIVAIDGGAPMRLPLVRQEDSWGATLESLAAGSYRITLKTDWTGPEAPEPVHDVFAVVDGRG